MSKEDLSEFSDLTQHLAQVKLDNQLSKERIYNRLTYKMDQGIIQSTTMTKDGINMRKNTWKSIAVTTAALVCLGGAFSTTSFAQDMIQNMMARFQVGNMTITQYDVITPPPAKKEVQPGSEKEAAAQEIANSRQAEKPTVQTLEQARASMGVDFPVPVWLSEQYKLLNAVSHGKNMSELIYDAKDGNVISLLISQGKENGISTADEVKTETVNGTKVYFANGIVIWAYGGFTYELYAAQDFDNTALKQIIASMSTKK